MSGFSGSLGCDQSTEYSNGGPPLPIPEPAPPSDAESLEQLWALGYLASSQKEAGASKGVTRHELGRTAPGLNLLTSGHGPVALLMDMDGTLLHQWQAEFDDIFPNHPRSIRAKEPHRNFWRDAVAFPNGDIVVIWELFGIFKLDRDSRVLWAVPEAAHHEVRLTQLGEIAHLQSKRQIIQGIPEKKSVEDFIILRDHDGRKMRSLAISEALENVNWIQLRKKFWARAKERGYGLNSNNIHDPFHTNSLDFLDAEEANRLGHPFKPGDALVSMSMLDTIAILDMEKGETRWSQQGPFGMQHSPRLTKEGELILFNNFLTPESSSLVTFNPRTRRVMNEYKGPQSKPLYSRRSGRVQVLANGNTLIVETDGGRAIELDGDGEVVWEFHTPYRAGENLEGIAHLYSLKRVEDFRLSWLSPNQEISAKD